MGEPINEPPVANGAEGDVGNLGQQPQGEELKINPAWNPLLEKIPDKNLQNMIMPTLREWDQNYQQGIQKVHSQYAPYKPFYDAQIAPEDLNNAMMVYQALQENPEQTIQALFEWAGLEGAPGEQGPDDPDEDDPEYDVGEGDEPYDIMQHPEIQRYGQMTELMAQKLIEENNERIKAEDDIKLDQELEAARKKHGDFDEEIVLPILHANQDLSVDEAVQKYVEWQQRTITNYRSPGSRAPILSGGGGGVPSQQTPIKGMSGQDRRRLIQETLARAHQGG